MKMGELLAKAIEDGFEYWDSDMRHMPPYLSTACAASVLNALERAGYVIVPREPTPEMRDAGFLLCEGDSAVEASDNCRTMYIAMLTALEKKA